MNRFPLMTVVWLALFCVCALGLTIYGFCAFITPEYRRETFHLMLAIICLGEVIVFAYSGYMLTVPESVTRPSPAMRMRILALVLFWFVVIFFTGIIAVHPGNVDSFFSDKMVLFQGIFTLFLLMGAFFLHRQDVVLQVRDEVPQRERVQLQTYVGGVDAMIELLRTVEDEHEDLAKEFDRLTKGFDTLRSQLLAVSPVAVRQGGRIVEPVPVEKIEEELLQLRGAVNSLADAPSEKVADLLPKIRQQVNSVTDLLRRREDALSF